MRRLYLPLLRPVPADEQGNRDEDDDSLAAMADFDLREYHVSPGSRNSGLCSSSWQRHVCDRRCLTGLGHDISYLSRAHELQRPEGALHVRDVGLELIQGSCDVGLDLGRVLPRRAVGRDLVEGLLRHLEPPFMSAKQGRLKEDLVMILKERMRSQESFNGAANGLGDFERKRQNSFAGGLCQG